MVKRRGIGKVFKDVQDNKIRIIDVVKLLQGIEIPCKSITRRGTLYIVRYVDNSVRILHKTEEVLVKS